MCLFIRNNKKSNALWVAKEDIECYKRLNEDYDRRGKSILFSPHRGFVYKLNFLYKTKIKTPPIIDGEYKYAIFTRFFLTKSSPIEDIHEGFHSYENLKVAISERGYSNLIRREEIFLCIIPKGSEFYYDNVKGEYCSNKIIIKKRVK